MDEHARRIPYWEHEQDGLACLGWFRWVGTRAPGHLRVSPRDLELRAGFRNGPAESVSIRREHVRRVDWQRLFLTSYVRFVHDQREAQEFVMFRAVHSERLRSELRAMGYPVA